MKFCSFTGHRKIKKEHEAKLPELILQAIDCAYSMGCKCFFTGGALGFDTLAAKEVIRFRVSHPEIRLILILPCAEQEVLWSERQKDLYYYILNQADEVIYVSEEYVDGCIKERNRRLVDKADIIISYVSRDRSGSAQTVRMAQKQGKTVYNLFPLVESNA